MLAYHITRAPTDDQTRDLPLPRRALYHWPMDLRELFAGIIVEGNPSARNCLISLISNFISVTTGTSRSPWRHMKPRSTVWFVAYWEHHKFLNQQPSNFNKSLILKSWCSQTAMNKPKSLCALRDCGQPSVALTKKKMNKFISKYIKETILFSFCLHEFLKNNWKIGQKKITT